MIDPKTFKYESSRWKDLYKFLKSKGYDVYSPGQKLGDCRSEYLVVKYEGPVKLSNVSSSNEIYSITCNVPKNNYSRLNELVTEVKEFMKELKPLFSTYDLGQALSFYDDTIQSHSMTIEYKVYRKD